MISCWRTKKSHREPGQVSTIGAAAVRSTILAIWSQQFRMNVLVRYHDETALFS